jgi:hypothetical protein
MPTDEALVKAGSVIVQICNVSVLLNVAQSAPSNRPGAGNLGPPLALHVRVRRSGEQDEFKQRWQQSCVPAEAVAAPIPACGSRVLRYAWPTFTASFRVTLQESRLPGRRLAKKLFAVAVDDAAEAVVGVPERQAPEDTSRAGWWRAVLATPIDVGAALAAATEADATSVGGVAGCRGARLTVLPTPPTATAAGEPAVSAVLSAEVRLIRVASHDDERSIATACEVLRDEFERSVNAQRFPITRALFLDILRDVTAHATAVDLSSGAPEIAALKASARASAATAVGTATTVFDGPLASLLRCLTSRCPLAMHGQEAHNLIISTATELTVPLCALGHGLVTNAANPATAATAGVGAPGGQQLLDRWGDAPRVQGEISKAAHEAELSIAVPALAVAEAAKQEDVVALVGRAVDTVRSPLVRSLVDARATTSSSSGVWQCNSPALRTAARVLTGIADTLRSAGIVPFLPACAAIVGVVAQLVTAYAGMSTLIQDMEDAVSVCARMVAFLYEPRRLTAMISRRDRAITDELYGIFVAAHKCRLLCESYQSRAVLTRMFTVATVQEELKALVAQVERGRATLADLIVLEDVPEIRAAVDELLAVQQLAARASVERLARAHWTMLADFANAERRHRTVVAEADLRDLIMAGEHSAVAEVIRQSNTIEFLHREEDWARRKLTTEHFTLLLQLMEQLEFETRQFVETSLTEACARWVEFVVVTQRFLALSRDAYRLMPFFVPDTVAAHDVEFDHQYTPVAAVVHAPAAHPPPSSPTSANMAPTSSVQSYTTVHDAWNAGDGTAKHRAFRRVLLEASAGAGKSTVVKQLARYPLQLQAKANCLEDVDAGATDGVPLAITLVVELATLEQALAARFGDSAVDVTDLALLEEVVGALKVPGGISAFRAGVRREMAQLLLRHRASVLVIFDGFDEVQHSTLPAMRLLFESWHEPPERASWGHLLVTSRPERRGTITGTREVKLFDGFEQLNLMPWDEAHERHYVNRFPFGSVHEDEVEEEAASEAGQSGTGNDGTNTATYTDPSEWRTDAARRTWEVLQAPAFALVRGSPLIVHLVCCVQLMSESSAPESSSPRASAPRRWTPAACFDRVAQHIFEWSEVKRRRVLGDNAAKSLANEAESALRQRLEPRLAAIAWEHRDTNTFNLSPQDAELLIPSSMIVRRTPAAGKRPAVYSFVHKCLLEFMAAREVVRRALASTSADAMKAMMLTNSGRRMQEPIVAVLAADLMGLEAQRAVKEGNDVAKQVKQAWLRLYNGVIAAAFHLIRGFTLTLPAGESDALTYLRDEATSTERERLSTQVGITSMMAFAAASEQHGFITDGCEDFATRVTTEVLTSGGVNYALRLLSSRSQLAKQWTSPLMIDSAVKHGLTPVLDAHNSESMRSVFSEAAVALMLRPTVAEAVWPWLTEHCGITPTATLAFHARNADALREVKTTAAELLRLVGSRPTRREAPLGSVTRFATSVALKGIITDRLVREFVQDCFDSARPHCLFRLLPLCAHNSLQTLAIRTTGEPLLEDVGDVIVNNCESLREIYLDSDPSRHVTVGPAIIVKCLVKCVNLRALRLNSKWAAGFDDAAMRAVSAACPHLEAIAIRSNLLTDAGTALLAEQYPDLRLVRLASCSLTDDSLRAIGERCPQLTVIDVRGSGVTSDGVVRCLRHCPALRSVGLGGYGARADAGVIAALTAPSHATQMTLVDVSSVSGIPEEALAELHKLTSLRTLRASANQHVTDRVLQSWATGMRDLQVLDVSNNPTISDVGICELLTRLLQLHTLEVYWSNRVSDATCRIIAQHPALVTLDIGCCTSISDAGIASIAACRSLRDLNMNGLRNFPTARGAEALVARKEPLLHISLHASGIDLSDRWKTKLVDRYRSSIRGIERRFY